MHGLITGLYLGPNSEDVKIAHIINGLGLALQNNIERKTVLLNHVAYTAASGGNSGGRNK